MNFSNNIDGRLSVLENLLRENSQQTISAKKEEFYKRVESRIAHALIANGIDAQANFNLVVLPEEPLDIKDIFHGGVKSIKQLVENPPEFRHSGWGLDTSNNAQIVEAKLWRVKDSRKIVDVYRDGMVVFCSAINDDNLSWGMKSNGLKLNCLALVESVTSFFAFFKEFLTLISDQPNYIMTQCSFNNLWPGEGKVYLNPGPLRSHGFIENQFSKYAPNATYVSEQINFEVSNFDFSVVSYQMVELIYTWFGIDPSDQGIPYVMDDKGILKINIDRIKANG